MYPKGENMIVMPITKSMEIIMSTKVCLISWINFDYRGNVENTAFLANSMHQYRVSQCGEHDCSAYNKKNGDNYEYPCLSNFG